MKISYNNKNGTNYLFYFIKSVITVIVIISLILIFIFRAVSVNGNSMISTLKDGDSVILTNMFYTPKCGDIVAISTENLPEQRIIKRIVAVEGQTLSIDYNKGELAVDGVVINEEYTDISVTRPSHMYELPYEIPKGYVFVMGDNRKVSLDSRDERVGLVSTENIIGKAQIIFYPFNRFTYLY